MQVTATNGNRRNLIEGQRITVRLETGQVFSKTLPAGNAIRRQRYRAEVLDFIRTAAVLEGVHRFRPASRKGAALIELFAANKARRVVVHGKRGNI